MPEQLWMAVIAGALAGAASAPHCFAMCGPLALFSVGGSAPARIARYQLGRLCAYALLGTIAGSGGAVIGAWLAPRATAIALGLVVAGAMIFAALRLVRAPTPKLVTLENARTKPPLFSRVVASVPREPALIGALSALLPCGALYTGVLIAVGAGGWAAGAGAMIAFALTSGIGLLVSAAIGQRARRSRYGRWIIAAVMCVGAAMIVLRPMLATEEGASCHAHDAMSYGCTSER